MQSKNHDRQFVCGHREAATRNKGCDLFEKEITNGHNREILRSEPGSEHAYFLICALYNRASHSTSCTVLKKTPFIDNDTILFFFTLFIFFYMVENNYVTQVIFGG